jgi:hypothetical protein
MPLLNYTTQIDTFRTISEISRALAKVGASAVMHDYDGAGNIVALSFKIKMPSKEGQNVEIAFRLPTDWHPVFEVMKQDARVPRRLVTQEQAIRVSWRITKDWIEAQAAFIETMMVTTAQVFLPYAVTSDGRSLYEYIGGNTQLLLGDGDDK